MATTNDNALFIDTNILIYANVAAAPLHEQALKAIKEAHQAGRPLWISRQVLREFIAARIRPQTFAQPSAPEVVIERVRYLEDRFQVADDHLHRHRTARQADGGFSGWRQAGA